MKKIVAALGFFLLAATPSFAQQAPQPSVIVTTGEGVVKRAPDRAWVTIAAESRARTAAEAQRLNQDMRSGEAQLAQWMAEKTGQEAGLSRVRERVAQIAA